MNSTCIRHLFCFYCGTIFKKIWQYKTIVLEDSEQNNALTRNIINWSGIFRNWQGTRKWKALPLKPILTYIFLVIFRKLYCIVLLLESSITILYYKSIRKEILINVKKNIITSINYWRYFNAQFTVIIIKMWYVWSTIQILLY